MLSNLLLLVAGSLPVALSQEPLIAPLVVGKVEIPVEQIQRFAIYGPGRALLELAQSQYLIDCELARRPGVRPSVSPTELAEALATKRADFERRYPTLDLEPELYRAFRSGEIHARQLQQNMLFDKVFLPENPALWTPHALAALRAEAGDILIDDAIKSYERRSATLAEQLRAWDGQGKRPHLAPEDFMYRSILRSIVRESLTAEEPEGTARVRQSPLLLTELHCTKLNGPSVFLRTADLWEQLEATITPEELLQTSRFLTIIEATRQRLEHEGFLLDRDDAQARYRNRNARRLESHKSWNPPASMPFEEAEGAYLQISESFRERARLLGQLGDRGRLTPELQGHLEYANGVMGLARMEAEILPVSAFDFDQFRWKSGGWNEAHERANELAAQLASSAVNWEDALTEIGEYWNPPTPAWGRTCWSSPSSMWRGKIGERSFGDLRSRLEESWYTRFLTGRSLTRTIFFDLPVGEISGPIEGVNGYYLVKVVARQPVQRPLNLEDEFHLELIRDSWLGNALLEYSREALELVGLPGVLEHS